MDHLRRAPRFAVAAVATLLGVVGLAVFVVLPAFATSGTTVLPPSSPGNVTPTLVSVGGQSTDCAQFTTGGLQQYLNPNPSSGTYSLGGNATLNLTLDPTPSTGWPAYTGDAYVSFSVSGASVYDVFVDGGSQTTWYQYPSGTSGDGYLHAPAQSTNKRTGEPNKLYSISHMTFCFLPGAPISGKATVDGTGAGGLTVSLTNTTTSTTTTTPTGSDGTYSFPAEPVGHAYTVCISVPTTDPNGYAETEPTSGASCASGQAGVGYTISSLGSGGSSGNDFAFTSLGSISGTVYEDNDQSGADNSGDSPQAGWTITLTGTQDSTTTSTSTGSYSFKGIPAGTYTICETQPSSDNGTWAQTEPTPGSANVCTSSPELPKGYASVTVAGGQSVTGQDFGNVVAQPCNGPGTSDYQVQFASCKPGESYVFNSGTTSSGQKFVSVFPSDQTQAEQIPDVEQITWPYTSDQQNQVTLYYDDTYPFAVNTTNAMPLCKLDPRQTGEDFALQSSYATSDGSGAVLPSGATSCLITTITSADQTYTAYVYSLLDGMRNSN